MTPLEIRINGNDKIRGTYIAIGFICITNVMIPEVNNILMSRMNKPPIT
jgi:hypothetical protein